MVSLRKQENTGTEIGDGSWAFVRLFARVFIVLIVVLYGVIVLLDPYNTLHNLFSGNKAPMSQNQRFAYPYIARSGDYNSLIIGTSTTRMMDPKRYDKALGLRVANLSLNSGTWWEQREVMRLFLRHHPKPKLFIVGIDVIWCSLSQAGEKLTHRAFPYWAYDGSLWNDYLHLFNLEALEVSGRKLGYLLGVKEPRYGRNGYRTLNKKGTPYNLKKARRKIYGQAHPIPPAPPLSSPAISQEALSRLTFPNLEKLDVALARVPESTRKLLIFVPYHQYNQGAPGNTKQRHYSECKKRIRNIAQRHARTNTLDFMCRTAFTMEDRNYWDVLHYNERAAEKIDNQIISFLKTGTTDPRFVCSDP